MKRLLFSLLLLATQIAYAHEYKLQFTPQGGAQGLVVAGFKYVGDTILGDCSYYTVSSGSGRDPRSTRTDHYNTCTWDLHGNLLTTTPGAPVVPRHYKHIGTEIIYAAQGASKTGLDTRGFGFVNIPSAHYTWQSASGGYADIPWAPYTVTATFVSDGDWALAYDGATIITGISGFLTPSAGAAKVESTTCAKAVAVGTSCSITVTYDPTKIACTGNGYAYTNITLAPITDSVATPDFFESFTVTGVPICDD
jgi:hypothetical protein